MQKKTSSSNNRPQVEPHLLCHTSLSPSLTHSLSQLLSAQSDSLHVFSALSRCPTWGQSDSEGISPQYTQLSSTTTLTFFSYSRRFSWYSLAARLLAGLLGLGSSNNDWNKMDKTGSVRVCDYNHISFIIIKSNKPKQHSRKNAHNYFPLF